MAILLRFNTFLRGRKKTLTTVECTTVSEDTVEVSPITSKDVTFFLHVTSVDSEWIHLDNLFKAAHHPQVLSLRHSLKLGLVDDFYARNNTCRIFKDTVRVASPPVEELVPMLLIEAPVSAPPPEEAVTVTIVQDIVHTSVIDERSSTALVEEASPPTIEDVTPPSTPLPEYTCIEAEPELKEPLPQATVDTKLCDADQAPEPAPPRPLRLTDFVEVDYIGSGSWGCVRLYRHRSSGKLVAIKSIRKEEVQGKEEQVLREQATLRAVAGQEGVLDLLGSFQDGAYFYLVTRYYEGGDLLSLMEDLGTPPDELLVYYAAQILLALQRIHERDVVHRDLKPANIFLDKHGNAVVGDFGLAAFIAELQRKSRVELCGTVEYLSRDVWQGRQYSSASDVWAFGAIIFELVVQRRMFDSGKCKSLRHVRDTAIGGSLREFLGKVKLPQELELLLDAIFENDDYDRPTLAALKTHPFFRSIDWEALENGELPIPIILSEGDDEEEVPMAVEPLPLEDDEDIEDEFPEFNWTSPFFVPAPVLSPVIGAPTPSSEPEALGVEVPADVAIPAPALVDITPESVVPATTGEPEVIRSDDVLPVVVDVAPELLVPLPESFISESVEILDYIPLAGGLDIVMQPESTPTALGFLDIDLIEPKPTITPTSLEALDIDIAEPFNSPLIIIEPEEAPSTPQPPTIEVFQSTDDDNCSYKDTLSSPDASSISVSSDDSSMLLTPTVGAPILPALTAEPSFPLLSSAFQATPFCSATSLASFASYPSDVYATALSSPSHSFLLLPGGGAKRSTVVHTPAAPPVAAQHAQIAFGDGSQIDYDAEISYEYDMKDDADADEDSVRPRRFVDHLKRLSRLPKSLSRSF